IANHQAQMDTALERETNRAKAQARQRFVEAESTANANAALLEAQALDIQAVSAAQAPEILEYRYEQDILNKLENLAGHLPLLVSFGDGSDGQQQQIDYLATARQLLGVSDGGSGISQAELTQIHERAEEIQERITAREDEISELLAARDDESEPAEGDQERASDEERASEQDGAAATIGYTTEAAGHTDVSATTAAVGDTEQQAGEQ